jgi:hypothetical protein
VHVRRIAGEKYATDPEPWTGPDVYAEPVRPEYLDLAGAEEPVHEFLDLGVRHLLLRRLALWQMYDPPETGPHPHGETVSAAARPRARLHEFVALIVHAHIGENRPQRVRRFLKGPDHLAPAEPAQIAALQSALQSSRLRLVTEDDVARVSFAPDFNGNIAVGIDFLPACSDRLSSATKAHVGKPLAIVLDDTVIYAPIVRFEVSRSAQITGPFSDELLSQLFDALVLKLPPTKRPASNQFPMAVNRVRTALAGRPPHTTVHAGPHTAVR